jgi:hypothetical protein
MAPSFNPDSAEVSEIILPDGSTASEVIAPDGSTVFSAIPDTLVDRPADDDSFTRTEKTGVIISTSQRWPSIQGRISQNTTGSTIAYLEETDGTVLSNVDISGLSSGDVVTFSDVSLDADSEYRMLMDADGSNWTYGQYKNQSQSEFVSDDGNLSVINDYIEGSGRLVPTFAGWSEIGNITL